MADPWRPPCPHVLVGHRCDPDRLRPDPVPAQPRARRRVGRLATGATAAEASTPGIPGPGHPSPGHDRLTARPDLLRAELTAQLSRGGRVAAEEEAPGTGCLRRRRPAVLRALADRRITGEPLAWITGRATSATSPSSSIPGLRPSLAEPRLAWRAAARLPPTRRDRPVHRFGCDRRRAAGGQTGGTHRGHRQRQPCRVC